MIDEARCLIGIPALNEESSIGFVSGFSRKFGEVLVVDDSSTDDTAYMAKSAGAEVITLSQNQGYGYALAKIFEYAKTGNYDILITLDGDGQHDPHDIPLFIRMITGGLDVVSGNRFWTASETPTYRKLGIKAVSKTTPLHNGQCGFRAYSRKAIDLINITEKGFGASLEILDQAKKHDLRTAEVPCLVSYDTESKRNPLNHGMGLIETILWSTIWKKPLKYLLPLAGIFFLVGFFSITWLLWEYQHSGWFPLSLSVISLGTILLGSILAIAAILIWVIKRGVVERVEL